MHYTNSEVNRIFFRVIEFLEALVWNEAHELMGILRRLAFGVYITVALLPRLERVHSQLHSRSQPQHDHSPLRKFNIIFLI